MKAKLAVLLAVFLLLAACAAPAPESDSAPPPENISDPEPEVKDVSHYYVDETYDGIEDREAVKELYWYLWENLRPGEYGFIDIGGTYGAETGSRYFIILFAPDRAPIDALLQSYDGSWAPIQFEQNDITLYDTARAEENINAFLREHPEINVLYFENSELQIFMEVEEITDELRAFADEYPIKDIFVIHRYFGEPNPD